MEKIKLKIYNTFFDDTYLKIDFEWFTTCDLNCSYCYNTQNEPRYNRKTSDIKDGLIKILSMTHDNIVVSLIGGEILLSSEFNDIMNTIKQYSKPSHKFLLFTHAQHDPKLFKSKMDSVLGLGDQVRVICSTHFEKMNYKNFEINAEYVNTNFKYCSFVIFPDQNFLDNKEYFDSIIKKNQKFSIEPLIFDIYDNKKINQIKNQMYFKKLKHDLKDYKNKTEMTYIINEQETSAIDAKYKLFTEYNYNFKDSLCNLRIYETRSNGDIFYGCDISQEPIANLFSSSLDELNNILKIKTIKCPIDRCLPNLCAIEIS